MAKKTLDNEEVKWRCTICDEEFTSKDYQDFIEESRDHVSEHAEDFIEAIQ